ncbi:MAG: CapA family protein [Planctomycetes bacterium]|nr:CapA family protein [Planctomycetota bacterium]
MAEHAAFRRAALVALVGVAALLGWSVWPSATRSPPSDPAPVAIDEPLAPDERSLVLVGDIMLARGVARTAERRQLSFSTFFDATRALIAGADLAFGNLESPISDLGERKEGDSTAFRAPPAAVEGLRSAGFDIVSLANNHALDYGPAALEDTGRRLTAAGIRTVGVGRPEEVQTPVILDARGVSVGFLAYCDPGSPKACNRRDRDQSPRPARATREVVKRDLLAARPQVDVLVVSVHWGPRTRTSQIKGRSSWAAPSSILGADIVAGHHPHVQQPAELYRGGVIFYSMGNFVFDQRSDPQLRASRLHRVIVSKDGVRRAAWLPLRSEIDVWRPTPTADTMVAVARVPRQKNRYG